MKKALFVLFACLPVLLWAQGNTSAQDRDELEKERQDIQRELKDMQGVYDKVKGQSKQALVQLSAINRQINLQERYIGSISKEIRFIDDDIYRSNIEIYRLEKQLDTLKAEYAKSVVYAYKHRSSYDYLNFIFAADDFNDALKRIAYLRSYRAYRQRQVATILETRQLIAKRKEQQLGRKDEKNNALASQTREKTVLDQQKKEKDQVLGQLKSQEKDLARQINAKKKRDNELKNAIASIVRKEIEREKEIARKKAEEDKKKNTPVVTNTPTTTGNTGNSGAASGNVGTATPATPVRKAPESVLLNSEADIKLSADFSNNKGRLPWPVDSGVPLIHFGRYTIEGTSPPLYGDNPGVTISTAIGTPIKAVFDGDIVGVYNLGDGMAVTIRHGKYFTTYSNLTNVSVRKGDRVGRGQALGRAGRDEDTGSGMIDFILMIETKNVNPEQWLRHM